MESWKIYYISKIKQKYFFFESLSQKRNVAKNLIQINVGMSDFHYFIVCYSAKVCSSLLYLPKIWQWSLSIALIYFVPKPFLLKPHVWTKYTWHYSTGQIISISLRVASSIPGYGSAERSHTLIQCKKQTRDTKVNETGMNWYEISPKRNE